jgi:hypothetical protein
VSIGTRQINALAGFLTNRDFNLPDLQACLRHMATAAARHTGSMVKAHRVLLESMTDDKDKRQIATILLKGKRGRPSLNKPDKRFAAEELLTNFTIYKITETPKKITDADFAEWYLYHSKLCPEADRKKLPVSETDIRMLQNRLSKARRIVNHAG